MHITTAFDEGVTRLQVSGDVDLASSDQLRASGEAALRESFGPLRIDLSGVTFMDSTGLSALICIHNLADRRPVTIENPSPRVVRLLQVSGMDRIFAVD